MTDDWIEEPESKQIFLNSINADSYNNATASGVDFYPKNLEVLLSQWYYIDLSVKRPVLIPYSFYNININNNIL